MKLVVLFCLLLITTAHAQTITSSIHSIDIDQQGNEHFIKLNSGEVVFVDDLRVVEELADKLDLPLEMSLDEEHGLVGWHPLAEQDETAVVSFEKRYTTSDDYVPSVVNNRATLSSIFAGLRKDTRRRSECFHRAYVWAYEEYKKNNRLLTKHFLFFTRRYIREYRYKWWFHVAPSVLFSDENGKEEFMMLDRTFSKGPQKLKEWTDQFISSKRSCPVVYVYSHYYNNQESEHCYLIPTPAYYLQPLDIENLEKTGVEKKGFLKGDLNLSYRRGVSGSPL